MADLLAASLTYLPHRWPTCRIADLLVAWLCRATHDSGLRPLPPTAGKTKTCKSYLQPARHALRFRACHPAVGRSTLYFLTPGVLPRLRTIPRNARFFERMGWKSLRESTTISGLSTLLPSFTFHEVSQCVDFCQLLLPFCVLAELL
jgi:hypothetical protein